MATYRKRGKKWEYRIRYTDPVSGKKRETSRSGFRTKAEAVYAASEVYTDVKDGLIKQNGIITIADYLDTWFNSYKSTIKSTSYRNRYFHSNIIKKKIGSIKMKNLTHYVYQDMLNTLSKELSRNTLISVNHVGQMMARSAVKDGYYKESPIQEVRIPHYDTESLKKKYWEPQHIGLFKKFCLKEIEKKKLVNNQQLLIEKERDLTAFYLLVYAGLRIGEVCALSVTDYCTANKEIVIDKTIGSDALIQNKDTWKVFPPKTKKSFRNVPLPEIAYKQLERWLTFREQYKQSLGKQFVEMDFLFTKRDGSSLLPRDIRTKFDRIQRKIDVPKITPHGLRHTYTALQIQAGTDPKQIQLLLGHSSIKTTLDIYGHITTDKKKESIIKFNNMLKGFD